MSEAPQRMSIYPLEGTWDYGGFEFAQGDEPNKVEYVRADRIEELEAKLAKAVAALTFYSCEDGCNECPESERDRVSCGWTARIVTQLKEGRG